MHHEHLCACPAAGASCHSRQSPEAGILIARDGDRYRLLHGQLRLAATLSRNNDICVEVRGEGTVRILKTGESLVVEHGSGRLPLCRNA